MVSVIVPVYKVEKYLPNCIESVLNQTFSDFELILVDDGSPDRSGAICDEYAQKYLNIKVIHKENGGLSDGAKIGRRLLGQFPKNCKTPGGASYLKKQSIDVRQFKQSICLN